MCHDINKKSFCNIFKKNRIIEDIVDYCCSEKIVNKGSFILRRIKLCTNTIKTLVLHNSETKCYLKIKFCTDTSFYATPCLKISWKLVRAALKAYFHYLHLFNYVNILLFHWGYFTSFCDHYIEQNIFFYSFRSS